VGLTNTLYFGDNLRILRNHIPDESVDLVYLDPPFNSNRAYNVFFQDKTGKQAASQIQAFEDTWHWTEDAQAAYDEMLGGDYPVELKEMLQAFREFMGPSDMMAYITMMAIRLFELRRILKTTGSLFLHCDPTASHYLKILLDQVFGIESFKNEIIWKRSQPKGHAYTRFASSHDVVLFYNKGKTAYFDTQYKPHDTAYLDGFYKYIEEGTGRRYRLDNLANPNKDRPNLTYEFPPGSGTVRVWRWTRDRMMKAWKDGRVILPKKGKVVSYKRYLDEMPGSIITDIWDDIEHLHGSHAETLGYPTQKPLALLERIIKAASDEDATVLDPFCGCGTTIAAAEKLHRNWIGIDITFLAVALIKKRIAEHFPDCKFQVVGEPQSTEDAKSLFEQSPFQFEAWAVSFLGGQPYKSTGGGDTGIDGFLYFQDYEKKFHKIIIEVKGGKYSPRDVRALAAVLQREKAPLGLLVALQKPTAGMKRDATTLGKWKLPGHDREYPVLQIVTIDELFSGKLPDLPDTRGTLKRAKQVMREKDQGDFF
jgi:site-specific DNA-methyltransferase (adenine-specific)